MKVGAFNCDTRSDAKNMMKVFKKKHKLDMYEALRPMFDPNRYAKDVLQIGSVIKHVLTIEDYQTDCKDEFESRYCAFARLTVDQVKLYKVNIDMDGVEDDGQNMYSTTYLTKLRNTPISSEPFIDIVEDLDVMMARICKRTRKWVKWTIAWKSRSKGAFAQPSPNVAATSPSHSDASSTILPFIQGLAQPTSGGDQPHDKNIPLDKKIQDGSILVIKIETEVEKKKVKEPKDTTFPIAL